MNLKPLLHRIWISAQALTTDLEDDVDLRYVIGILMLVPFLVGLIL